MKFKNGEAPDIKKQKVVLQWNFYSYFYYQLLSIYVIQLLMIRNSNIKTFFIEHMISDTDLCCTHCLYMLSPFSVHIPQLISLFKWINMLVGKGILISHISFISFIIKPLLTYKLLFCLILILSFLLLFSSFKIYAFIRRLFYMVEIYAINYSYFLLYVQFLSAC